MRSSRYRSHGSPTSIYCNSKTIYFASGADIDALYYGLERFPALKRATTLLKSPASAASTLHLSLRARKLSADIPFEAAISAPRSLGLH